jgi:hypothetical protein
MKVYQNAVRRQSKHEQLELDLFSGDPLPSDHLAALQGGQQNQSTIVFTPKNEKRRWHELVGDDLDRLADEINHWRGHEDVYVSVNNFFGWRRISLGTNLNAFFVDIDYHDASQPAFDSAFMRARALYMIEDELKWPTPNLVIESGRGIHIYWLFDKPVPFKALPRWQHAQRNIVAALGGDRMAADATRVLRLAGTINSKSGTLVKAKVWERSRYDFEFLWSEYFSDIGYSKAREAREARHQPDKPARVRDISRARADAGRAPAKGSIYVRWHLVYSDLRIIVEHRFNGKIPEPPRNRKGHRGTFVYFYAVALSWFTLSDALEDEVLDVARRIAPSLSTQDVLSLTSSVRSRAKYDAERLSEDPEHKSLDWNKSRYKYRRETLWTQLREYIPDDLIPRLRAIVPASVIRERQAERKRDAYSAEKGSPVRAYGKRNQPQRDQAWIFHNDGLSTRQIAEKIGVSQKTVSNWIRARLGE